MRFLGPVLAPSALIELNPTCIEEVDGNPAPIATQVSVDADGRDRRATGCHQDRQTQSEHH